MNCTAPASSLEGRTAHLLCLRSCFREKRRLARAAREPGSARTSTAPAWGFGFRVRATQRPGTRAPGTAAGVGGLQARGAWRADGAGERARGVDLGGQSPVRGGLAAAGAAAQFVAFPRRVAASAKVSSAAGSHGGRGRRRRGGEPPGRLEAQPREPVECRDPRTRPYETKSEQR